MKKEEIEFANGTQLNLDAELGLDKLVKKEREPQQNETKRKSKDVVFNDAGKPINVNTGYSSEDLRELYEEDYGKESE